MTLRRLVQPVLLAGLAALAACSGGPSRVQPLSAASGSAASKEIDAAFDFLMAGREDDARKMLRRLLKRDPMSANARLLSDSIDRDPKELLGPTSYAYAVRPGDTIIGLAERVLGNRLKAYQLVRYNGLKPPVTLTPGQSIRMPGEPPRAEPVRRREPEAAPTPAPRVTTPKPAAKPQPGVAPKPQPPTTDPAAARVARTAGLAALNAGDVRRAVALLHRAAALDPGNSLIRRDLARAQRIAAAVRARR